MLVVAVAISDQAGRRREGAVAALAALPALLGAVFFSSRRRHTRSVCDWSSDVCSSDLIRSHFRRTAPELTFTYENISIPGANQYIRFACMVECLSGSLSFIVTIQLHEEMGSDAFFV